MEPGERDRAELAAALAALANEAGSCNNCALRQGCRGVVFGEGNPASLIMFVGEGPGETEDELGRPFVGKAGQLLDKILTAANLPREKVYITNIVKCRPPGNRTPVMPEMQACLPWLRRQFAILRPKFMVLLGLAATHGILNPELKMGESHGHWFERGGVQFMPTYHPAAVLRNPGLRRSVWEDFRKIRDAVLNAGGQSHSL
ncbi:Uracil DNA glycosylase superfamily [Acididesulfobacillus acetoxydans]|uniref:Type-4 uracil-DNA glycosylase n=1 Tax=Acididesulfobacillus acetoxydans TaxID=1561005 RepID=A0A8S0WH84_9FIRM|nr:uracil-DNA glycosylase [Acididesulfobacillus acetoxydans]CAA7602512.1 Uracil DNA glycosylase superfamily [Acididesulfobacillus acetoxydans]CEJ05967.1 Uracil-DNA glycosylase-like protein [Acididesulfobacillus acetoxydans]